MRHIFPLLLAFLAVSCSGSGQKSYDAACFEDLAGCKVSTITGSTHDLFMSENYPEVNLVRVALPVEDIAMVKSGKADYLVDDNILFLNLDMASEGLKVNFSDHSRPGYTGAAFRLDDTDLCAQFNAFLATVRENGVYDEMAARWSSKQIDTVRMPDIAVPAEGDPLEIATLTADMPFSYMANGGWAGFEIEMGYRFAASLGRPVHFSGYDFAALVAALNSSKVDMVTGFMTITEERAKSVLFSDPYYESYPVCVSRLEGAAGAKVGPIQWIRNGVRRNLIEEDRWKMLLEGLWETLVISFWAIILGTILGALVCAMRMSRRGFFRGFAKAYINIMRGVPILVFLMVMFYVVFGKSGLSATWVAVFAFAMNLAAYVSEMFRSGIEGVDKGQTEAGWALGFSRLKTFVFIVAPQAIKRVIPVYKGEVVSLIKNTSIVGYIAIQDLTKMSDIIRSRTFDAFFPLLVVSLVYFLLAWLLGLLLDHAVKED